MTGTADTEAPEFLQIYGLEVIVIPTHMDMVREDFTDLVYLTQGEKFDAILEDIRDCRKRGQPALVGTASIDTSEYLSELLRKESIPHNVLNAKQHAREAEIIVDAGRPGTITIATNMAGRGTDIVLGGNLQAELDRMDDASEADVAAHREEWNERHGAVLAAGGLHIIGTERHESRRIDNQLRGRSGRQGDVGSSRFYLSLEDDLMRIFASDRVSAIMQKLGMEKGEAIEHPWVTKAIENAQRKVEGRNFDVRKQLLEYDDVANDQRKEFYALRNELMAEDDVSDRIAQIRADVLTEVIDGHIAPQSLDEQWDVPGLEESLKREFDMEMDLTAWLADDESLHEEPLRQRIADEITAAYEEKKLQAGEAIIHNFEKAVMLQVLDAGWKEHLAAMDYLRQGIHLRGYAQKNPKQEYKREAFAMFQSLTERIKYEVINLVSKVRIREESDVEAMEAQRRRSAPVLAFHPMADALAAADGGQGDGDGLGPGEADPVAAAVADEAGKANTPFKRPQRKIGRNEPCPCGSGKKYKQCHGRVS
jgi:preprotein translocase subunit SecA